MGDKIFIHGYAILVLACMHPIWRNIHNSVNYPNCDLGEASGAARITVHHKNLPNMIGQLTAILAADGHNIANMLNKSKGEWAYSMFDMEKKAPTEETVKKMEQIDGVVRVRVL